MNWWVKPMNDLFIMESCNYEIGILESSNDFSNRFYSSAIQLMNHSITGSIYTESVLDSIGDFIKEVIKKIKELADKIEEKVRDKMLEVKFQQKCKELKRRYAADKTAYAGKKVQVFDYVKYRKKAHELIREFYKVLSELDKRDWKSEDEFQNYLDRLVDKMEIQDKDYYLDREIGLFIDGVDQYLESIFSAKKQCRDEIIKVLNDAQAMLDKKRKLIPKPESSQNKPEKKEFFVIRFIKRVTSMFSSLASSILGGFGDGAWKVVTVAAGLAVLTAV